MARSAIGIRCAVVVAVGLITFIPLPTPSPSIMAP